MNAPAIVSADGSGPSVRAGMRRVADADLEEGRRERGLDLVEVEVELVGTDADEARIEDEVRVRPRREQRDQGRLALDGGGVDLDLGEARPADLVLLDRHLPPPGALVELDEEDLAGPILVEGDRLGRARVGVGDRARAADLRRVPVAEREVVETAGGDLVGRDDDLVAVGLARDRDGAVDHADPPGRGRAVGRGRPVEALQRALGRPFRAEDAGLDDGVQRREVDRRPVRIEDGDHAVVRAAAGHRGEVVGAVDRRAVAHVVGARDDDRPDLRLGQPLELGRDALHGAARLDVRVEQVAGDEEEVDLLARGRGRRPP